MASSVPQRCPRARGIAANPAAQSARNSSAPPRRGISRTFTDQRVTFYACSWRSSCAGGEPARPAGRRKMPISAGSRYHDELIATAVRAGGAFLS